MKVITAWEDYYRLKNVEFLEISITRHTKDLYPMFGGRNNSCGVLKSEPKFFTEILSIFT